MSNNGHHGDSHRFEDSGGRRRGKRRSSGDDAPRVNGHDHGKAPQPSGKPPADGGTGRRPLSEISHLFLSDLRSASSHGRTPPRRIPPGGTPPAEPDAVPRERTIDLTAEEFQSDPAGDYDMRVPPVSAVIGAKLGGKLIRRACQFAAGLAAELPVGLIVVESSEVRLMWVAQGEAGEDQEVPETIDDPERLSDAILEMSCDIARWLVVLPDPRLPQARRLLAGIREWVLLAPAEHEGVVSGYRVLKGLCDLELPEDEAEAPRVTLALVDASDAAEAQRHARKLVGVCRQFLDLQIEAAGDPVVGAVSSIGHFTAREVVCAAWTDGTAEAGWTALEGLIIPPRQPGEAAQDAVATTQELTMPEQRKNDDDVPAIPELVIPPIARPAKPAAFGDWAATPADLERLERRLQPPPAPPRPARAPAEPKRRFIDDIDIPELAMPVRRRSAEVAPTTVAPAEVLQPAPSPAAEQRPPQVEERPLPGEEEVIDLPTGDSVAQVVLARLNIAETAIHPPMLPSAKLCVSREGAIVLVAAASPGLTDLPAIGRAMTWATENRLLLRMALAQYRLDESADVRLHLLVSRADANADALRPLMSTGRVAVQAYRRLTWGGRCGLLLEAA